MSGSDLWFRVPVGSRFDDDVGRKASKLEATIDLLGRWHRGEAPSVRELRATWSWSYDRVTTVLHDLATWCEVVGARYPKRAFMPGGSYHRLPANLTPTIDRPSTDRSSTDDADHKGRPQLPLFDESSAGLRPGGPAIGRPSTDRSSTIDSGGPTREECRVEADPRPIDLARAREEREREKEEKNTGVASGSPRRPAKAKKPTVPGYHEAIALWDDHYRLLYGMPYPWVSVGRQSDWPMVKAWLATARVTETDRRGLMVLDIAIGAYMNAAKAGTTWPKGDPPAVRHFTRDIAKWLRVDPNGGGDGDGGGWGKAAREFGGGTRGKP